MNIRKASPKDAKAIADVTIKSWRHAYRGIMAEDLLENLSLEERSNGWEDHLKNGGEAYVLLNEKKIIGVIGICQFREKLKKYKQYAEIPAIYLLPENIGQGLGDKLINFAINLLKSRSSHEIAIWVLEQNQPAIEFYKKMGFVNSGEVKEFPPTGLIEQLYIKIDQLKS